MKRGWWYSATREQKLAQVRAGIELGMTAQQIAMNCGCYYERYPDGQRGPLVNQFAAAHGLSFPHRRTAKQHRNDARRSETMQGQPAPQLNGPRDLVAGLSDWTWTGEDAR